MNLSLKGGELGKYHYHRFYKEKGNEIQLRISKLYFLSKEELKKIVYMGNFQKLDYKDPRNLNGECWYDNLKSLKKGDWIYYNKIGSEILGIGKNFLFKAIFSHEQAVPDNQRSCSSIDNLCQRCKLFGFSSKEYAYKGRLYTSNFTNNIILEEKKCNLCDKQANINIETKKWIDKDSKNEIASQYFLPILGAPKPNKRDVLGYYDQNGFIKGAKYYKNAKLNYKGLSKYFNNLIFKTKKIIGMDYSHKLRNFAQICREGVVFKGTVGLENVSAEEMSGIFTLLNEGYFKIGVGKPLGLGKVKTNIKKVWIRTAKDYNNWKFFLCKPSI
jgi:CRISPR/Cas system CSM-associated protein Csm3 (group 7 of RAMP superfamily)